MSIATTEAKQSIRQAGLDRDRILLEQLPQVRYIAQRIHQRLARHVALEDLVSAGVIGLIDAIEKFDARKKVQIQSYAQFRIHGAIMDSLRELDWSPRELRKKARQMDQARQRVERRLNRTASQTEIAAELGISLEKFHSLTADLRGLELGQLQVVTPSEDDLDNDVLSFTPSAEENDPFFLCLRGEMKQLLARAIEELPEKERLVLNLYYFEELNMKEVGEVLEIGESRVSQLHTSATNRLRARLGNQMAARTPVIRVPEWQIQAT